jgi:hypothetical protein
MRRRLCCAALFVASLLLAAGVPNAVLAQSKQSATRGQTAKKPAKTATRTRPAPAWRFSRERGVPTLAFGAGSEEVISFSCQPDSGLLRVISQIGARGVRPGDGAAIRLTNGRNKFEIAGTAFSAESNQSVDIGGATQLDPKLFALFRTGDTLVVDVPGRKQAVPVTEARGSAEAFQKACLAIASDKQTPAG